MHKDEIVLLAADLSPGEVRGRQVCPKCRGGQANEASLSVGRHEDGSAVWWKCWRASCGYAGGINSVTTRNDVRTIAGKKKRTYRVQRVPEDKINVLEKKVKSAALRRKVLYTKEAHRPERFLFPITTREGAVAGWVMRSYEDGVASKAITDVDDYKGCAWWTDTPSPYILVLVEDIPSAAWMFENTAITSCALMGAAVTKEQLHDILAARPQYVVVCLDPDALAAAIKVCSNINAARTNSRALVVPLKKDIKDMSADEVKALASHINTMIEERGRVKT